MPTLRGETYRRMHLAAALERGAGDLTATRDYARAAEELAFVLERCVASAEKPAVRAAHEDALLAAKLVSGLDREMDARAARRVHAAALAVLPAQKRAAFESAYKTASVERARKLKLGRRASSSLSSSSSSDDAHLDSARDPSDPPPPADVADLPADVLNLAIGRLAPRDLARASCVSRDWRARVEEADAAWRAHARRAFGEERWLSLRRRADDERWGWRYVFARAVARWPELAPGEETSARVVPCVSGAGVGAPGERRGMDVSLGDERTRARDLGVAGARRQATPAEPSRGGRVVFRVVQLVQLVRIERRGRRGRRDARAAVPAVEHPARVMIRIKRFFSRDETTRDGVYFYQIRK